MAKADNLAGLESGLNISEAFLTLEKRAKDTFHDLIIEITNNSGGVVSFQTASHSASEIVGSLYGPIFSRIDPEEVGSRARAMRIGEDYGLRLNQKFKNLKQRALSLLSQSYTSHGFVIDEDEARILFHRVSSAGKVEKRLVEELGTCCRIPERQLVLENVTPTYEKILLEEKKDDTEASTPKPKNKRTTRKRSVNGANSEGAATA